MKNDPKSKSHARPKKKLPPPGRKLSMREAQDRMNEKFGKALAKLADA
jgi:hypothetical protein